MPSFIAPNSLDVAGPLGTRSEWQGPAAARVWHTHVVVCLAMLFWLAATAWARPLMLPDEGRYVGVAWEMWVSGHWLTPTLDGLPFFHKPPLFYWITAASMSVFGANPWAARAAPLLGAWLGAVALYLFAWRWVGAVAARRVALALAVQPLFFIGGQFANMDMLVAGCITATILAAADAVLCKERGLAFGRSLVGAYALAGLGCLAKGLIGVAIPVLVIVAWLVATGRWRRLGALLSWPVLVIFAAVAAPWCVANQLRFPGFFHYFIVVQHFQRFVGSGFNNVQPWWFYAGVLALSSLPWAPLVVRRWVGGRLDGVRRDPVRSLMGIWIATVVVFFSLPQSKPLGYVLPAVPPLAYLLADCAPALLGASQRVLLAWRASIAVAAALCLGSIAWFAADQPKSTAEIASVLKSHRVPGEPVLMLGHYYYDVPFHAWLWDPVTVVDEWHAPGLYATDSWRRELADAGQFAPAKAAATLLDTARLPAVLCRAPVSWVIGEEHALDPYAKPNRAQAVLTVRGTTLWRVEGGCPSARSSALFSAP
ncbi:MAG: glycosyltransferase family 39 protein [Burkholderiales bacterium]|nr:glycosyltransferase family 39 protein [Burkholderiales bacterium]